MTALPGGDIKIIIGDMNAKVGNDNTNIESVMGREGLGPIRNDNGERLIDFCTLHNLFIGGTRFTHKDIHKYTWESPDCRTRNQIDHVLVSKLFAGSLEDVKTRRSADMDSDYQLLVGTFRLRPAAVKQTKQTAKYEVSKLQDPTTVVMYNNSLALNIKDGNWEEVAETCKQTAKDILGTKNNRRKPWITDNTWAEIQKRKKLKHKIMRVKDTAEKLATRAEYRRVSLTVKSLAQSDKNLYYNNIVVEMEQATNTGNMRKVYASIKKIGGNNIRNAAIIKDSDGNILTSPMSQLSRWREYYIEQQRTLDSMLNGDEQHGNNTRNDPKYEAQTLDLGLKPLKSQKLQELINARKVTICEHFVNKQTDRFRLALRTHAPTTDTV
ncbi:uncharacterized protein LOC142235392 [Haematobia irritans]|uniref:uncharacterized protein LOC142235392 n=1 Tax=Haematobia irritans TaxID=7368 RepID=UPI003F4FEB89